MDIRSTTGGGSALAWTTVEVFPNRSMANLAGTALSSAGLPVRVIADDVESVGLPLGLRFNGAELQVRPEDLEEARDLLGSEMVVDPDDVDLLADDGDSEREDLPLSHATLDLGVGTAFKVIAALLLIAFLAAALWSALG